MKMILSRPVMPGLRGGLPKGALSPRRAFRTERLGADDGLIPDFKVEVDLGQLPLSVGLFAGAGASFMIGSFLPSEVRPVTTVAAIGLGLAGIINLFRKSQERRGEEPQPLTEHRAGAEFSPASEAQFSSLSGEITSPREYDEISGSGWFSPSYSVRVVFHNPSSSDVEFLAELRIREQLYNIVGFDWPPVNTPGESRSYAQSQFIKISAGKDRIWDFVLRTPQGFRAAYVETDVELVKKREAGDSGEVLDRVFFIVR